MKSVQDYTDATELQQLMANAKRLKRDDVYWSAFRRLCQVKGLQGDDPLHVDFFATLCAYEELLSEKNGRRTSANRTRQKLSRHGVVKCLEDWATDTKETTGFSLLVENGLVELTGEYLVLKHPQYFSGKAIEAAKARLQSVQDRKEIGRMLAEMGVTF